MSQIEGDINESFYLCEGIWLDNNEKTLKDKFNNKELCFTNINDCILILEREVRRWILEPMAILIDDDIANKSKYFPFKNSIFALYGIFSYIEKIQRYKKGKPYTSGDTQSTSILTDGFKELFPKDEYSKKKINKILKNTRHSLMHTGNIGDHVLINNDYKNCVEYKGSNSNLEKIELNVYKMLETIMDDFDLYIKSLKEESNTELRQNFQSVFNLYYDDEISIFK